MSSPKKGRGHQKKGTHGSLTKAGKSRDANPVKNWRIDPKTGVAIRSKSRKSKKGPLKGDANKRGRRNKIPRIRNRQRYNIATMCPACSGTVRGKVHRTPIRIRTHKCWQCGTRLDWKGMRPKIRRKRQAI